MGKCEVCELEEAFRPGIGLNCWRIVTDAKAYITSKEVDYKRTIVWTKVCGVCNKSLADPELRWSIAVTALVSLKRAFITAYCFGCYKWMKQCPERLQEGLWDKIEANLRRVFDAERKEFENLKKEADWASEHEKDFDGEEG